jgi:hypothetical protein
MTLETSGIQNLLPAQPIDSAVTADASAAARWLNAEAHADQDFQTAHVISAHKWRYGRRPVTALPLYDRVVYRSAVALLGDGLTLDRKPGDYEEFEQAPIAAGAEFVLVTDIANFYASIDVDLLCRLLMARTGEWQAVDWLQGFLTRIGGNFGGIPQGVGTSDQLGDTLSEILLERLRRSGHTVWRYADDFRFAAATRNGAIESLEAFDQETRALGLSVNERKTYVMDRVRYEQMVEAPSRVFTEAWNEARSELSVGGAYGSDMEIEVDDDEVFEMAALNELKNWAESDSSQAIADISRPDLSAIFQLLVHNRNVAGLDFVGKLLQNEPQHTPVVCRYLRDINPIAPAQVCQTILSAIQTLSITKWQSVWILDAITRVNDPNNPWEYADISVLLPWMRRQAASTDPIVAAHGILALARHHHLTLAESRSPFVVSNQYSLPFQLAALAGLATDQKKAQVGRSLIERLIAPWAASTI